MKIAETGPSMIPFAMCIACTSSMAPIYSPSMVVAYSWQLRQ
jgi:hypothetical protein